MTDFQIHTRDSPKLTDKTVTGCSGFHGACLTLAKITEARLKMYKHSNNKVMGTGATATMLSTVPHHGASPLTVFTALQGLMKKERELAVYTFDPVGSYQRLVQGGRLSKCHVTASAR